jgi:hypothetical protein
MLKRITQLPGMSPWILMDFRSPRRPLPEIQDFFNRKGLISDQGEKKEAFYVLQAAYRERVGVSAYWRVGVMACRRPKSFSADMESRMRSFGKSSSLFSVKLLYGREINPPGSKKLGRPIGELNVFGTLRHLCGGRYITNARISGTG